MSDPASPTSPPPFACRRCNQCCRGKGGIYLEADQVAPAARELGLPAAEFTRRFLTPRGGRFEVLSGPEGLCCLLGPQGCRVHRVKPAICRLWPFFPGLLKDPGAFEEAKLICPGLAPGASHAEFVAFAQRQLAEERNK